MLCHKGVDPDRFAVERLAKDMVWFGHTRIILRTDDEHAISKLLRDVSKSLRIGSFEHAGESHVPMYDPSCNGATENACRVMGGRIRTLRLDIEDRISRKIPVNHPTFSWLVEHAPWVMTSRSKLDDGTTPYQQVRGSNVYSGHVAVQRARFTKCLKEE